MSEKCKLVSANTPTSETISCRGVKRNCGDECSRACTCNSSRANKSMLCSVKGDGVWNRASGKTPESGSDCLLIDSNDLSSLKQVDVLENCRNWVTQSQDLHEAQEIQPTRNLRSRNVRKECHVFSSEDEQDIDSPDEDNSSGSQTIKCTTHFKGKRLWVKDEKLQMTCEWKNCSFDSSDIEVFIRHVSRHIPDLDVRVTENNEEVYVCLWALCEFETEEPKEVVRHVNFHSYHTKLKSIGIMLMKRFKIPNCTYDPEGRNAIPDIPEEYECCWTDCDRAFNNMQIFLFHVQSHVQCNPRGRFVKDGVPCGWKDCNGIYSSIYKLRDHVKTHTQEKVVGCPTCGSMFSSRTKFLDHCRRQVTLRAGEGYSCSHCCKVYPSERLFRDHVRLHVNLYKCRFCDMTCPTPSALILHVRFRHLDERVFKCHFCDFRGKTRQHIRGHMNTHFSENLYHCSEEGCNYSCRSSVGMKKHISRVHEGQHEPLYCCHICNKRFQRGASLTSHAFRQHDLRWPSGHKRFRYYQHEDGLYRLQLVRYESLEVTQMISEEISQEEPTTALPNKTYNLRRLPSRKQGEPEAFEVVEEQQETNEYEGKKSVGNKVLITISNVDDSGNVIQSEVMETEELTVLPNMDILEETA